MRTIQCSPYPAPHAEARGFLLCYTCVIMRRLPELRSVEFASSHQDLDRALRVEFLNVLQDRQRETTGADTHERILIQPPDLARLTETERAVAQTNIRLLSHLKGHRGRIIRTSLDRQSIPAARHLQMLLDWVDATLQSGSASVEALVTPPPSAWWAESVIPEDLYERLTLMKRAGTTDGVEAERWLVRTIADITDHPEEEPKWMDLVQPFFASRGIKPRFEKILATVGFLPRGLTTRKSFRGLSASDMSAALGALRELETTSLRPLARYERARLTNAFIARGRASDLRAGKLRPAMLDTNGVRIDLNQLHTHIPYGLLENETLTILKQDHWMPEDGMVTEVRLRRAEENMESEQVKELADEQLRTFLAAGGFKEPGAIDVCVRQIHDAPDQLAKLVVEKELVVPDRILKRLLASGPDGKFAALRLAEGIGAVFTEERLTRRAHLFLSYDLLKEQDEAYRIRKQVLHQPGYYNALKIARAWLTSPVAQDPDQQFLALQGRYHQAPGQEAHTFIAAVHKGRVTRVLIDEQKHLHAEHRQVLESIPRFDRTQYETLEDVFRTFEYFSGTVNALRKESAVPPKSWPKRFHDLAQTALHFILSNVTERTIEAERCYRAVTTEQFSRSSLEQFLEILDQARAQYAEFLYQHVGSTNDLEQEFMPEIFKQDLAFGEPFIEYSKATCATDGYDEQLCKTAPPVRVVQLRYKSQDPTRVIPYHVEESCLEALRLNRTRPLINIVGGCRFVGGSMTDESHPLNRMTTAVMRVAHRLKANVGVPGTQSGIGIAFGLTNTHYRNEFGHLPKAEQAHLFAISPGGNTAYPGNEWTDQSVQSERFAITPVDSIVTPFESDWGAQGIFRLSTPYRDHIAYMEALYDRVSREQPRVTVAGNGGLYSVMELVESIPRGFNLLLIRDSGRFAEAASAVIASGIDATDGSVASTQAIMDAVRSTCSPEVTEEFFRKDFGTDPAQQQPNQEGYRTLFFHFLRLVKQYPDRVAITSQATLEQDLDAFLATKKESIRRT